MKKKIEKTGRGILVAVMTAGLIGCGETLAPTPIADAPELPPLQSMQMDLSFFGDPDEPDVSNLGGLKLNFLNAAVRVAFINVSVVTALTPPSLAFAAAIHTFPSQLDDGSYLWIYTWVDGGLDHQVRLHGTPGANVVDWELHVVLPGEEEELWFRGESRTDRDEGYWVFSDFTAPEDPEILRIDWQVHSEEDATLDFLNVQAGSEEEGDQLRYRSDGPLRSMEFTDASTLEDWDIIWNEDDGTGSLRVPDYNDGERACWDSTQEDTECPGSAGSFLDRSVR
jgi:hypothetical protein